MAIPAIPDLEQRGACSQQGSFLFSEAYWRLKLIGQRQQMAGYLKCGPPLAEQQDDLGAQHKLVPTLPVSGGRG